MLWYASGVEHEIACSGVPKYLCWNGYGFDGRTAARRGLAAVLDVVEAMPGYDTELLVRVRAEMDASRAGRDAALSRIAEDQAGCRHPVGYVESIEAENLSTCRDGRCASSTG